MSGFLSHSAYRPSAAATSSDGSKQSDRHAKSRPAAKTTTAPTVAENKTIFQAFEWYCPPDQKHWQRVAHAMPALYGLGVSHVWIPPACKASAPSGNGYDIYDLYDLGEFLQKGSRSTKWGSKDELLKLVQTANMHGIGVLFDAVLNHKAAADATETVVAREVVENDRTKAVGEALEIEAWTKFEFPGRGETYSQMKWNASHFNGTDYDSQRDKKALFKFESKEWADDVDGERGNYDYLMFNNVDHRNAEVRHDIFHWVQWLGSQMRLGGMRLDAIKHYSKQFQRDLIDHATKTVGKDWFIVGEYFHAESDPEVLSQYIEYMDHRVSLFDFKLAQNFSELSLHENSDLRTIFEDTLSLLKPSNSITFVVNHDTQDGQALETPVAPFFIPIAYALILLRADAGTPCVFFADLYGSFGRSDRPAHLREVFIPPCSGGQVIPRLMLARKLWAYGDQHDYFDMPHVVGFTRTGHPWRGGGGGLAVLITNGWTHAKRRMFVGRQHAGERWVDLCGWWPAGEVVIGADGWGVFHVLHRSVSVWVDQKAIERATMQQFVFDTDIYGFRS